MRNYYLDKLAAEKLRKCYEIAPPRVQQYLRAEVDFVLSKIQPGNLVLVMKKGRFYYRRIESWPRNCIEKTGGSSDQ